DKTVWPDEAARQMWVEGTLDADGYLAVAEHVSACPACRSLIAQYKQLMWDLQHPQPIPVPAEQAEMYDALMGAWRQRQADEKAAARSGPPRRLIPAWAGYSVAWTGHLPPVRLLRNALHRRRPPEPTGAPLSQGSLARRTLRRIFRRGGGD